MSTRLANYKKTGDSVQSRRDLRRENRAKETKAKRDEKFMNRRTLSEINIPPDVKKNRDATKQPKDKRANERMEELVKWRQMKGKKKAEEKKSKEKERPPFVVGKYKEPGNKSAEGKPTKETKKPAKRSKTAKKQPNKMATQMVETIQPAAPQPSTITIGHRHKVNHPAWIPGATVSSPMNVQGFDEMFTKTFSPFKFTGTESKTSSNLFTFNKAVATSSGSVVNETLEDSLESYDEETTQSAHCRSDDSVELINHSILHNHQMTNTNNNAEEDGDDVEMEATEQGDKPSVYAPFRQLHDDVVERFTSLCNQWEAKEAELQEAQQANDEVYDQIRTTVCQARLLMRSKLKQYIGLVDKAEDPTQPIPTTAEDLQGFWDMVYFQVSSIEDMFRSFSSLEASNWEETSMETNQMKAPKRTTKKRRSVGKQAKSKTPSDKLKTDRAKRAEQRQKLREKIIAAKKNMKRRSCGLTPPKITSEVKNTDVPIAAITPSKTPSKSGKRKSKTPFKSANKLNSFVPNAGSGLTPSQISFEAKTTNTDVPIADLLCITPPSRSEKIKRRSSVKPIFTSSSSSSSESGLVTRLVRINAPKKLIQQMGSDVIMSPARRSVRLHRKSVGMASSDTSYSMDELPEDYVYRPNKSITYNMY